MNYFSSFSEILPLRLTLTDRLHFIPPNCFALRSLKAR